MIHGLIRVHDSRLKVMTDTKMIDRLKEFMECEGRSCSFDPELITPEYVYRMWGGSVAIEEIATGLRELIKDSNIKDYET